MRRREFFKKAVAGAALTTVGLSLRNNICAAALQPRESLALAGTRLPSCSNFTWMFPTLPKQGAGNPRLEEGLIELGKIMREDAEGSVSEPLPPVAGYTYLGQFIDHDLTLDLTSLEGATPNITETPNFRTPFLDLDHVYGGGPNLSPFLYKTGNRRAERFLIGMTKPTGPHKSSENDLPRNPEGLALVGDPRQDENLILAQLHVVFLKLHNKVLKTPGELANSAYYGQAGSLFAATQRLVKWHYQWVVRHDFLEHILDSTVFENLAQVEKNGAISPKANFQIPIEFSAAAFRFGHSMVRNGYHLREKKDLSLAEVLKFTGPVGGARPQLQEDLTVDWKFFFPTHTIGAAQRSEVIDTRIVGGLYELPIATEKLFNVPAPDEELRLPIRTLLRGARIGLPSGENVAKELGFEPLCGSQMATGLEAPILKKYGFVEDSPLWYYILKEAEVLGRDKHLGPTGSKLIADVIMSSLTGDPDSYLSVGKGEWLPTLPVAENEEKKDFNMTDLIVFATHQTK